MVQARGPSSHSHGPHIYLPIYLPQISPISPLYLPYISPTSPLPRREAILAQLQRLPPIAAPSHLFQAVLGSADKEELRDLVAEIGREIRS